MRALADAQRIQAFIRALAPAATDGARLYLTGGATAVLLGWRTSTIDIDIRLVPDADAMLRAIPNIKERLAVNVELASPPDFIPELPGWEERSLFVTQEGRLAVFHYDLYAQALSKIERSHAQDVSDVREMLRRGLVKPDRLRELFDAIEPQLYRYPAVDPASFRRAVDDVTGGVGE